MTFLFYVRINPCHIDVMISSHLPKALQSPGRPFMGAATGTGNTHGISPLFFNGTTPGIGDLLNEKNYPQMADPTNGCQLAGLIVYGIGSHINNPAGNKNIAMENDSWK